MLKEINQGGSHESNPLGGVPMGVNSQGTPVTYEQGETAIPTNTGEYVFSDRLKINKEISERLGLPKSMIGKSFADASKSINNKFKERTDKISESTKNKFLSDLINAQDIVKQEEAIKIANALNTNSTDVPDMMNGQTPRGMEPFSKQMNAGGFVDDLATSGPLDQAPPIDGVGVNTSGSTAGNIAGAAGTLLTAAGKSTSNLALSRAGTYAGIGGTLGSVIPGVGTAIGAAAGAVVGGVSGLIAQDKLDKKEAQKRDNAANKVRSMFTDSYANGGRVKHMPDGGDRNGPSLYNPFYFTNRVGIARNLWQDNSNFSWDPDTFGEEKLEPLTINVDRPTPQQTLTSNTTTSTPTTNTTATNNNNSKNPLRALRYAPILANAYQLAKLDKPTMRAPMIDDSKARRDYIDTQAAINNVNSESNAAINSLSQAGISGGALRNSIAATMLNRSRALGDIALRADAMNKQIDSQADQIDRQTNLRNMAEQARVQEIYDRDLGAYNTNKSRLIGKMGDDIGDIGSEALNRDLLAKAYGYTVDGEYVLGKDGEKLSISDFIKKYGNALWNAVTNRPQKNINNIDNKALGGHLFKNK